MGSTVAMQSLRGLVVRSYGRPESVPGPGRPYEVELLALADQSLCGRVGRVEQLLDVRVLVGEDCFDRSVERVIHALRRSGGLRNELLIEDVRVERLHLIQRHVDVRLDPGVGEVVLRLVEERQCGNANGLLRRY